MWLNHFVKSPQTDQDVQKISDWPLCQKSFFKNQNPPTSFHNFLWRSNLLEIRQRHFSTKWSFKTTKVKSLCQKSNFSYFQCFLTKWFLSLWLDFDEVMVSYILINFMTFWWSDFWWSDFWWSEQFPNNKKVKKEILHLKLHFHFIRRCYLTLNQQQKKLKKKQTLLLKISSHVFCTGDKMNVFMASSLTFPSSSYQ
jgi:hypothetical protein